MCFRTSPSLYTYSLDGLGFFINRARNQFGSGRFWVASIQLELLSYRLSVLRSISYRSSQKKWEKCDKWHRQGIRWEGWPNVGTRERFLKHMLTPDTAITVRPHISKRRSPCTSRSSSFNKTSWNLDHFGRLLGRKFRFYESMTREDMAQLRRVDVILF